MEKQNELDQQIDESENEMIEIDQPDPLDLNGKRLMKITGKLWVRKKKQLTKEHLVIIFTGIHSGTIDKRGNNL